MRGLSTFIVLLSIILMISTALPGVIIEGGNQRTAGEMIEISWTDEDVLRLEIIHNGEIIKSELNPAEPYLFKTEGLGEGVFIVKLLNPYDVVLSEEVLFISGEMEITQLGDIQPSPNPFYPLEGTGRMEFTNVPEGAKVRIFDFGGFLVDEFTAGASAVWNGYNKNDELVSSGPYIFQIEHNGEEFVGKFAVIK